MRSPATSIHLRRCVLPRYCRLFGIVSISAGNDMIMLQGRPRLKKAVADAYSSSFNRPIDPETEVVVTSGANEGILYRERML